MEEFDCENDLLIKEIDDNFISRENSIKLEQAKYSLISKIFMVIGTWGVGLTVAYSSLVYDIQVKQFLMLYNCSERVFFWSTQINFFVQIFLMIPCCFVFAKYLKICVWLTVLSIILGSTLKVIFPASIIVFYIGQTQISFGAFYAYNAPSAVGSLIFTKRGNQIFTTVSLVMPKLGNAVIALFPSFLINDKQSINPEIIILLHQIGLYVSLLSLPLMLVSENWKVNQRQQQEPATDEINPNQNSKEEGQVDNVCDAMKHKLYWVCLVMMIIIQQPVQQLSSDYAIYLQKHYGSTQKESSYHVAYCYTLGVIVCLALTISSNCRKMCKILLYVQSIGTLVIGLSNYFVKQYLFRLICLIFGETLFAVGSIGNLGFLTMVIATSFERIDKNILIAVPTTIGVACGVGIIDLMVYLGPLAWIGIGLFNLGGTVWVAHNLPS